MEVEDIEGCEIDTSRLEEYRKYVPVEVRRAAMLRMQGYPELDEEDEESGEPADSEA